MKAERRAAYIDGLAEGYRIAESIANRWKVNHMLIKPESVETLTKWTDEDLTELKKKLGRA